MKTDDHNTYINENYHLIDSGNAVGLICCANAVAGSYYIIECII